LQSVHIENKTLSIPPLLFSSPIVTKAAGKKIDPDQKGINSDVFQKKAAALPGIHALSLQPSALSLTRKIHEFSG
jgi:hypothetical protein